MEAEEGEIIYVSERTKPSASASEKTKSQNSGQAKAPRDAQ